MNIYGNQEENLDFVMNDIVNRIKICFDKQFSENETRLYEHLIYRIKDPEHMKEKCHRNNLEATPINALKHLYDSIGLRVVCLFREDVYKIVEFIRNFDNCTVFNEKDYIKKSKPNGYRSYHMIIEVTEPIEDIEGNNPGKFYVEIQLRTIAMDTWAALEHEIKYKKDLQNPELIEQSLKLCADQLASCDIQMQTVKDFANGKINK